MGNQFCSCQNPTPKPKHLNSQKQRIKPALVLTEDKQPNPARNSEPLAHTSEPLPPVASPKTHSSPVWRSQELIPAKINKKVSLQSTSPCKTLPPFSDAPFADLDDTVSILPFNESTNLPFTPKPSIHHHRKLDELKINQAIEAHYRTTNGNKRRKYSKDDFEVLMPIGEGGFGFVELVRLKRKENEKPEPLGCDHSPKYAMKRIPKKEIFRRRMLQQSLLNERKVLVMLQHRFIVNLMCAFQDPYNCYFVMEYASGGDVYSLLNNKENPQKVMEFRMLGEPAVRYILASVVLAIQYLHNHKIMYRDLKPENVLIFEDGSVKLTDFGLAKHSEQNEIEEMLAGTKIYYAPEMLENKKYNMKIDFWTLGIFLHELIFSVPPFHSRVIVKGKFARACSLAENQRSWRSGAVSQQAKNIINEFLRVDPDKRLGANGFNEIKLHKFFENFDWEALEKGEMVSPLKTLVRKFPTRIDFCPEREEENLASYSNIIGFTFKTINSYQK